VKLNVNFIGHRKFWDAGTEIPDHLVPDWARIKHRCSDVEAAAIRQRREELRAEARERREKMEAKKAAGKVTKQSA
jgi:hypothetical protein